MRGYVLVHVNGVAYRIDGEQAFRSLSSFLREDLRATGTKIVCEEGDCGACTVLVGRREGHSLRYRAINSCIQFLFQLDGAHVVTVEGLARQDVLTPLQESMIRCHGAQCGYCTPGFVMAMAGIFEHADAPGRDAIVNGLTGNLCRCTGYEPIIRAAEETKNQPRIEKLFPSEPILDEIARSGRGPIRIGNFFRPVDLESAIEFKAANPGCVIVQGATDFGVWRNKRGYVAEALLSLDGIEGLGDIRVKGRSLQIGARVSLAEFEQTVREVIPQLGEVMERFGSPQIRNVGTLAGNIANASPIADTLPFLYVSGAAIEVRGLAGTRTIAIPDFYRGYKQLALAPDEIITQISIPLPEESETLRLYKVSKRSHLDISTFTAAMLMQRRDGVVNAIRIAYGGVAPVVLRLPRTEEFVTGRPFSAATFIAAGEIAREEIAPISDVRGSREFRLQLASNVLESFYHDAAGAR